MPEIWLNYGVTDVVLDIRAENLDQTIDSGGPALDDAAIEERLGGLDLSGPVELAVMHDTRSVRKVISSLHGMCERRSVGPPRILAERAVLGGIRAGLPEGAAAEELAGDALSNADLVFLAEAEFDGLFGYETVSTRLIRMFGSESMLGAYARRQGNLPAPGQYPGSLEEARKFADGFEVKAIEVASSSAGIAEVAVGHPSKTASVPKALEAGSIRDVGPQRAVVASTGRDASNRTLGRSLSSLWNCAAAVKKDGLAVLVAECGGGLGSEALQRFVEGRITLGQLRNPTRYVQGMEDLLFLSEVQKGFQVGLVSVLPEFYAKKLGIVPLPGARASLEYILKTQGPRQKVTIVSDGARLLLR